MLNFLQDYHISKSFVYLIDIFINYNKSVIVMDSLMFNWYAISHTVSRNGLAKEGRKDQVKGNHVRRNRECIKASLDFSKEIILVKYLCEDYIKFFLERI